MKKAALAIACLSALTMLLIAIFYWAGSKESPTSAALRDAGISGSANTKTDIADRSDAERNIASSRGAAIASRISYSPNAATLRWLKIQQSKALGENIKTLAQSDDVLDQVMAVRLAGMCLVVPAIGEDVLQMSGKTRLDGSDAPSDVISEVVKAGKELQRQCARVGNDQLELVESMMKKSIVYKNSFAQNIGRIKPVKAYGDLSPDETRSVDAFLSDAASNLPLLQMHGSLLLSGPLRSDAWDSLQTAGERSAALELITCAMGNDCSASGLTALYLCFTEMACSAGSVEDAMRMKLGDSTEKWERANLAASETASALHRNDRNFFRGLRP